MNSNKNISNTDKNFIKFVGLESEFQNVTNKQNHTELKPQFENSMDSKQHSMKKEFEKNMKFMKRLEKDEEKKNKVKNIEDNTSRITGMNSVNLNYNNSIYFLKNKHEFNNLKKAANRLQKLKNYEVNMLPHTFRRKLVGEGD